MCNHCSDHAHTHQHFETPQIVQMMPVTQSLYAVYRTNQPMEIAVEKTEGELCLVPVLFMALIRHGEKTMVEGFFASTSIQSCEEIPGFQGYAASLEDAAKLYAK